LTVERFSYYPVAEIIAELERRLADSTAPPDVITLSGAGEPTLYADIGELIHRTKSLFALPVAVITNGSLLGLQDVRRDLAGADLVLPSLDTASERTFRRINRPHPSLDLGRIVSGLQEFRRQFPGQIWLEILLVEGINDGDQELAALQSATRRLKPDRIQLNTVDRPAHVSGVRPVSPERLHRVAPLFGKRVEVIGRFHHASSDHGSSEHLGDRIIQMLSRRPCTDRQISEALGVELTEVAGVLHSLSRRGRIDRLYHQGNCYYSCTVGR
jgi:wyosine [tRNA(Phe)-imidazoG37] synthetase (radical SAM superfamily)